MIYKFITEEIGTTLEVSEYDKKVLLNVKTDNGENITIPINKKQLYNLIGCLHSIQTNINKIK